MKPGTKKSDHPEIACFMTVQNLIKDIPYSKEFKSVKEIIIPKVIPRDFGLLLIY
jgi:hypothetical protein